MARQGTAVAIGGTATRHWIFSTGTVCKRTTEWEWLTITTIGATTLSVASKESTEAAPQALVLLTPTTGKVSAAPIRMPVVLKLSQPSPLACSATWATGGPAP